ncbi:MAG: NosD domain-containing protein [Candidatus Thorarchaeota archaeon]
MYGRQAVLLISLFVMSMFVIGIASMECEQDDILAESPRTPADPVFEEAQEPLENIFIDDNLDFETLGFPGNGKEQDPYIIEGYVLANSDSHLIHVQDTTVYFEIRNCQLDGLTQDYYGIYLLNVQHANVSSNVIQNCNEGIYLNTVVDSLVQENTVANCLNGGIVLLHSHSIDIKNDVCSGNSFTGIFLGSSDQITLINNLCWWNGYSGIYLHASSWNTLIQNTCNHNAIEGISVTEGSNHNILEGNIGSDNRYYGISVDDSAFNQLTGNQVAGCPTGFLLYNVVNNSLSGNTFEFPNHDASLNQIFGFHLSWCSNTTLSGNTINIPISVSVFESMDVHIAGFYLQWCSNATIAANIIDISVSFFGEGSSHVYGVIMLECHDSKLTGNSVTLGFQGDVFGYYMGMHLEWSNRNTLSGNDVVISADNPPNDFEAFCIRLIECAGNTVSGNVVLYNASGQVAGIYLGWSDYNEVHGNTATGCEIGLALLGCEDNILSGNSVEYCYAKGINLVDCTRITLSDNTALNSPIGFWLLNSHNSTLTSNTVMPAAQIDSVYGFFLIEASNNTMSGNTVNIVMPNIQINPVYGFILTEACNNTLSRNIVTIAIPGVISGQFWIKGFILTGCHSNTLLGNHILFPMISDTIYVDGEFWIEGFVLSGCHNNTLSDNGIGIQPAFWSTICVQFLGRFWVEGFVLTGCHNNTLLNNYFDIYCFVKVMGDFWVEGFVLSGCHNNTLLGNYITITAIDILTNNGYQFLVKGFVLSGCHNNTLSGNAVFTDVSLNELWFFLLEGFVLSGCHNNTLSGNAVYIDAYGDVNIESYGFYLSGSHNTTLTGNEVSIYIENPSGAFEGCGYCLFECQSNTLLNNSVDLQGIIDNGVFNGFSLEYCNANIMTNNMATGNSHGFYLASSSSNTLINNSATSNSIGFYLEYTHDNILTNNTAACNYHGCYLTFSSANTLISNTVTSSSAYGFNLDDSDDNILDNNTAAVNLLGFRLSGSNANTLTNNTAIDNTQDGFFLYDSGANILVNNTATSNGHIIGERHGFYLSESSANTLTSNTATSNDGAGFYLWRSSANTLTSNTATSNAQHGFYLWRSSANTLTSNTATSNDDAGFYSESSNFNTLTSNTVISNRMGFFLESSNATTFTSNTVTSNYLGFLSVDSSANILANNTATSNSNAGYMMTRCSANSLTNNTATCNGMGFILYLSRDNTLVNNTAASNFYGFQLSGSDANSLTSNTATGNYYGFYLDHCRNVTIDGFEGASKIEGHSGELAGIWLHNCDNVTVRNYWIMGFEIGIDIHRCSNGTICVNHIRSNGIAVSLASTTLMTIERNIFTENNIALQADFSSIDNSIYLNLFMSNVQQISIARANTWFFIDPYSNKRLGNYWNNYWGIDDGSDGRVEGDGIGDTNLPHEGVDEYPLVDPSIPMGHGGLPVGDDWWIAALCLVWSGGWSPVEIQVTDPLGNVLSSTTNEIGLNAWYFEETRPDGTMNVLVMIVVPVPLNPYPQEVFSLEMVALEDSTYSMEWFVSYGDSISGIGGEVLFERNVEEAPLTASQTRLVETEIKMTPDGVVVEAVAEYDFSGFLKPIKEGGTNRFPYGMSIPIKFALSDDEGEPVSTAHAVLELALVIDGEVDEDDYMPANSTAASNDGNVFRYDPLKEQYVFNLDTMEVAPETYRLRITLDDGQVFEVDITIV